MNPNSLAIAAQGSAMDWLLIIAAAVVLFSLVLAWLGTLIIYGRVEALRKLFPATHNLIRCHVDYLIMAGLLGLVYFSCLHLGIVLPTWVVAVLCFGVVYNPLGFIFQAVDPGFGKSDTLANKLSVCTGFLPATIGFGYAMVAILAVLI